MKTISKGAAIILMLLGGASFCSGKFKHEGSAYPIQYLNRQLTTILVNDNFVPPPASRVYAYTSIGAYSVLMGASGKENVLRQGLIEFPAFPKVDKSMTDFSPSLASSYAFYYLTKKLVYTFEPFNDSFNVLLDWYRKEGCTDIEIANSKRIAKGYFDLFADWIDKDNFAETRRMPKYTVDEVPGHWTPTYPGYMFALEPNWQYVRPLMARAGSLDLSKFVALPYDTVPSSKLHQEAAMVNNLATNASKEQKGIADFWDCNAFAMFPNGHAMDIVKKMSPGGHWMNIVTIVTAQANADMEKSAFAYALTATALFDAFIHTWKLKYLYQTMRPETYLQNQGYPEFRPYLQSPPFPEYPSGHAVISMAAALALTHIFGPSFYFTDNTEDAWNIPPRSFKSFTEAATEAGISRYYGLIHYKYSCDDGSQIGAVIGNTLVADIKK
jgi:PAP2 superfamily